jgi:ubiquinone/menaquinone biosynthesis C-methylase UbiE
MLAEFLAGQLGRPSGFFGRRVLARTWNRRNRALNDAAFDALAVQPDDRVVEIGFGGGYLLGRLAQVVTTGYVAGMDISETMVRYSSRQHSSLIRTGRMRLCCAAAETAPFPPALFDKACTVNSIFYWNDVTRALQECSQLLTEQGALVLCFTCRESLQDRSFARQGLHLVDIGEVQALLASVGFSRMTTERLSDRHRAFWCVSATKSIG